MSIGHLIDPDDKQWAEKLLERHQQRTVSELSKNLRVFLEDKSGQLKNLYEKTETFDDDDAAENQTVKYFALSCGCSVASHVEAKCCFRTGDLVCSQHISVCAHCHEQVRTTFTREWGNGVFCKSPCFREMLVKKALRLPWTAMKIIFWALCGRGPEEKPEKEEVMIAYPQEDANAKTTGHGNAPSPDQTRSPGRTLR